MSAVALGRQSIIGYTFWLVLVGANPRCSAQEGNVQKLNTVLSINTNAMWQTAHYSALL